MNPCLSSRSITGAGASRETGAGDRERTDDISLGSGFQPLVSPVDGRPRIIYPKPGAARCHPQRCAMAVGTILGLAAFDVD
jgi:hypothetical protein